eukprot:TRINITY_DN7717_c0_g1_i3.p1 TRINITY_DN7717_c0_g1~~TRINITY_DN7717_c0_g1_i3.p1  ORF type:complete len:387 (-),score=123.96 TRINITY_DN7717_c0_g1_i3:361-1521(-)
MKPQPPRSTLSSSSAASDVYKRQTPENEVLQLTAVIDELRGKGIEVEACHRQDQARFMELLENALNDQRKLEAELRQLQSGKQTAEIQPAVDFSRMERVVVGLEVENSELKSQLQAFKGCKGEVRELIQQASALGSLMHDQHGSLVRLTREKERMDRVISTQQKQILHLQQEAHTLARENDWLTRQLQQAEITQIDANKRKAKREHETQQRLAAPLVSVGESMPQQGETEAVKRLYELLLVASDEFAIADAKAKTLQEQVEDLERRADQERSRASDTQQQTQHELKQLSTQNAAASRQLEQQQATGQNEHSRLEKRCQDLEWQLATQKAEHERLLRVHETQAMWCMAIEAQNEALTEERRGGSPHSRAQERVHPRPGLVWDQVHSG